MKRKNPPAHINEISTSRSILNPTAQTVLQDVLTLSPQARSHILNSLTLIENNDFCGSPAEGLQINNLRFDSPLSIFTSSRSPARHTTALPTTSPVSHHLLSSSTRSFSLHIPHSPTTSHVTSPFTSQSSSPAVPSSPVARVDSLPASRPRSPTVPLGFALPNECPPPSPVVSHPIVDFLDSYNNASDLLLTYPPLLPHLPICSPPSSPASSPSLVEDDIALIEGVKTSTPLVLDQQTPQNDTHEGEDDWTLFAPHPTPTPITKPTSYPSLFPPRAFK
ncbi:hypothetical protein EDB92DRAFT_1943959 [Lactarius akahatsu]|uniref:Uncharacterized protein n=1 Tax=Lactarius akahatsu TaxID=416441 RepID=A0AAD4LJY7_9AGAM|nr:hypothetical protein EDB92DRAFT_1943959 [Lactarius akahatsu]